MSFDMGGLCYFQSTKLFKYDLKNMSLFNFQDTASFLDLLYRVANIYDSRD